MQEVPAPLASTTPGGAQGTGHGSAGLTSLTGPPGAGVSAGVASTWRTPSGVEIPQYTWEPAIICDQEVVLEDQRGVNTASLTRDGAATLANCSGFGFTAQGTDLIVRGKGGGLLSVQAVYNWWNGFTAEGGHAWADTYIEQTYDSGDKWICSRLIRKGSSGKGWFGKHGGSRKGIVKGSRSRSRSRSPPRGPPGPDGFGGSESGGGGSGGLGAAPLIPAR